MAIQVSIDGKTEDEHKIGHAVAAWAVAAIDLLGRALVRVFEGVQGVRVRERTKKQMQLVDSLALGNRRHLLLIACGGQQYLVGAGADSVSSILAIEPSTELADSPGAGSLGSRLRAKSRTMGRIAKGPQLVRDEARQIVSEHDFGRGLWP